MSSPSDRSYVTHRPIRSRPVAQLDAEGAHRHGESHTRTELAASALVLLGVIGMVVAG